MMEGSPEALDQGWGRGKKSFLETRLLNMV